jgi:hypothetical protein
MRTIHCDVCGKEIARGNSAYIEVLQPNTEIHDDKSIYNMKRIDMCKRCREIYAQKTSGIIDDIKQIRIYEDRLQ